MLHGDTLTILLRHPEAFEVKRQMVALYEEVYGPEHPETARALNRKRRPCGRSA